MLDVTALTNDPIELKRLLIESHGALAARDLKLRERDATIEHLRLQLAQLRRWRYGQSSEQLESAGQIPLTLEELKVAVAEAMGASALPPQAPSVPVKEKPVRRKSLPEHFDRLDNVIAPKDCGCPDCGTPMSPLGKPDIAEVAEVKTVTFTVTRHIRPKLRCSKCSTIVQAPAPSRPIPKSYAGASLLALILTWKYAFHLPLYRQCQVLAAAGLKVSRTTLMEWVGGSSELLGPLVAALGRYVLSALNLNADDTPIKVLAPGTGKTKKGRIWTYVRDGRAWGSRDPPAVWYRYSPSWHGRYPQKHLENYRGKLQVDAYAGFDPLFVPTAPNAAPRMLEIACWAHSRRKFFDLLEARKCPTSKEALERIGKLYEIEAQIRGQSAEARLAARQSRAVPALATLKAWMLEKRALLDPKNALCVAFDYTLRNWEAFVRYTQDGRLEIDNNSAERSIRGMATERSLCTSYLSV